MINLGSPGLSGSGNITFSVNPTTLGDYRLFGGSIGSPNLSNFTLPTTTGESYSLSTAVDSGFLDLVVLPSGGTWNSNNNGNLSWTNSGSWYPTMVPSSGTLTFADVPGTTAPITVTLDGPQSAGALVFNVTSSNGYTIAQGSGGALTLGTTGSSISVLSGTHTISAPVVLTGNLAISTTNAGLLILSGSVSEATQGTGAITLNAGELVLSGTGSYTGGTTVNGGTMYLTNPAAIAANTTLTVGAGGTFIFDPNGPTGNDARLAASPAGAVEAVPEPGSLALLSVAGILAAAAAWRRRKAG